MLSMQDRAARDARAVDQIVHAIDATQQRGLAATGRSDERRDGARRDVKIDIEQDLMVPVGEIEVAHLNHRGVVCLLRLGVALSWRAL